MKYEIQSRSNNCSSRDWSPDGMGGPNEFDTEAEAEVTIESLQALGEEWDEAEYRVRAILVGADRAKWS